MQYAVNAEADAQAGFLRLDMNIGGTNLSRVIEYGLQQLDNRRFFRAHAFAERAKIDVSVAEIVAEFARESGDFFSPPIDTVYRLQQLPFGDNSQVDVTLQGTGEFIEGQQIRGIGHANQQRAHAIFQHQGAEAAHLAFR